MRVRTSKFGKIDQKGQYIFREYDDFEFENPENIVRSMFLSSQTSLEREILKMNNFVASEGFIEEFILKRAFKEWKEELDKYKSIKVHENLINLLETDRKKDQVELLKGISLTADELIAFIFKAYELQGYTYSQYKASHLHKGLNETLLPEIIHIDDDGTINTIGKTEMTDGQLRQVVEHRNVVVSKFLDKDDKWHCFFLTLKSLSGKESYKGGQPHLHYISSAWNLSRENVKEQLTRKKYSLPSLPHIDFHTHRNPRTEKN